MASFITKNELVAAKRRCDLLITSFVDGSRAPRGTNFTGFVYVSKSSPSYLAATGILTNKRVPLIAADDAVEATDQVNDRVQMTGHGREIGDGPFRPTTTAGGFVAGTNYWALPFDANNVSWSLSLADAYAGVKVNITADVTGMIFQDVVGTTERGIDGQFTYEWTQAETNFDGSEGAVSILGHASYDAYTTVTIAPAVVGFEAEMENGRTYGDGQRMLVRGEAAKFSRVGNDYMHRNLADTKDSHGGTMTEAGRVAAAIVDPTP